METTMERFDRETKEIRREHLHQFTEVVIQALRYSDLPPKALRRAITVIADEMRKQGTMPLGK